MGLVDLAAKNYRVIIIDRPGFGHSSRPRNVVWTPDAQARLIRRALERYSAFLTSDRAGALQGCIGRGRSGSQVSRHGAGLGSRLGLLRYPTLRPGVVALSAPAVPVVGDILVHTLSPMISRIDVAAHVGEDIRTQVGAGQVRPVPERADGLFVLRRSALRPPSRRS